MTTTIELSAEEEAAYRALAAAEGLSIEAWLKKLANHHARPELPPVRADNLADFLLDSPFARSELNLERIQDSPRPLDLE